MPKDEIFVAAIFVTAVILVIAADDDQRDQQDIYCEMVAAWEASPRLPPEQRPGWPPYKGKEMCNGN